MSNSSIITLEYFSPELFLEIFRFLNGYDIYKAFHGLNHRISKLVSTYGIKYIDLIEIKLHESRKILCDINCSEVNILKLSSKYNDEQIDQILNKNSFHHLRSLTLDSVGIFTIHSIISQRSNLSLDLESLIIRFQSGLCQEKLCDTYKLILKDFCSYFKSLKLLDLSILDINKTIISKRLNFSDLASSSVQIRSSLQYLSIDNTRIYSIEALLSCVPNLHKLNAIVKLNVFTLNYPMLSNLTFCMLRIFSSEFLSVIYLLRQCPNLQKLKLFIDPADDDTLDSSQWQDLIETYLLKLKQFQVNMIVRNLPIIVINQVFIDEVLQNKFWLERKTEVNSVKVESTTEDDLQTELMIKFAV